MKNLRIDQEPTNGTFFVKANTDIPLSVAKKMLEHAQKMSRPENPVVSVSNNDTLDRAQRTKIIFKNTP